MLEHPPQSGQDTDRGWRQFEALQKQGLSFPTKESFVYYRKGPF